MPSEYLLCTGHSAGHSEGAEEGHPDPARSMHILGVGLGKCGLWKPPLCLPLAGTYFLWAQSG